MSSPVSIFGEQYELDIREGYTGLARMCIQCKKLFKDDQWGWLGLYRHYMLSHEGIVYGLLGPGGRTIYL